MSDVDPYLDPVTRVLRNKIGFTSAEDLERVERDVTSTALLILHDELLPGRYDLKHLCDFHQAIFGDLYPWAGHVRTVALAKGDMFCLPQFIESYAADVFGKLAKEDHLKNLNRNQFIDRLTHYFGEVNALHPFREGNGRTQRAFFWQLARGAGFDIRWERISPPRNVEASIAIMRGDAEPMRLMLSELTTVVP